jgi:hypothetical protein
MHNSGRAGIPPSLAALLGLARCVQVHKLALVASQFHPRGRRPGVSPIRACHHQPFQSHSMVLRDEDAATECHFCRPLPLPSPQVSLLLLSLRLTLAFAERHGQEEEPFAPRDLLTRSRCPSALVCCRAGDGDPPSTLVFRDSESLGRWTGKSYEIHLRTSQLAQKKQSDRRMTRIRVYVRSPPKMYAYRAFGERRRNCPLAQHARPSSNKPIITLTPCRSNAAKMHSSKPALHLEPLPCQNAKNEIPNSRNPVPRVPTSFCCCFQ